MFIKLKNLFFYLLYGFALTFLLISLLTYNSSDASFNTANNTKHKNFVGIAGGYISDILMQILGIGSIFILLVAASNFFLSRPQKILIALLLPPLLLFLSYLPPTNYFPLNNYLGLIGLLLRQLNLPQDILLLFSSFSFLLILIIWYISFYKSRPVIEIPSSSPNFLSKSIEFENDIIEEELPIAPAVTFTVKKERNTLPNTKPLLQLPPLSLLCEKKIDSRPKNNTVHKGKMLEQVLADFRIEGKIIKISEGPVVTLYELEPSAGTKSARVISLATDIARSLSSISARIAAIPGRNVLGIELPNEQREPVFLRELLENDKYQNTDIRLPIVLGKSINGTPVIVDLTRMPHLLVAGTTGSGKSVAINAMLLSLLYRLSPEECKLILIDPKMLELSVYDHIPHLLSPVVTEPRKAVLALKWVVQEMESRYRIMANMVVRNIDGYNQKVTELLKSEGEKSEENDLTEEKNESIKLMPYIVVIVDEMADLMLVAGKDIETYIQRLAQMARASGIHIIMATQRPSVDVITGVIKANFPSRISFAVTSKIDSRTILGEQGAEQLLGKGDMLYMAAGGSITRVHGPFVSDDEVHSVVRYLKEYRAPEYTHQVTESIEEGDNNFLTLESEETDDLYKQAVAIVLQDKKVSISYIQRKLKIGYNRAATIIEKMEKEKVISLANHSGKREILLK